MPSASVTKTTGETGRNVAVPRSLIRNGGREPRRQRSSRRSSTRSSSGSGSSVGGSSVTWVGMEAAIGHRTPPGNGATPHRTVLDLDCDTNRRHRCGLPGSAGRAARCAAARRQTCARLCQRNGPHRGRGSALEPLDRLVLLDGVWAARRIWVVHSAGLIAPAISAAGASSSARASWAYQSSKHQLTDLVAGQADQLARRGQRGAGVQPVGGAGHHGQRAGGLGELRRAGLREHRPEELQAAIGVAGLGADDERLLGGDPDGVGCLRRPSSAGTAHAVRP